MEIGEFYKKLEESTLDLDSIGTYIKTARNQAIEEKKDDLSKAMQWELDTMSFRIENNELLPMFTLKNEHDEIVEYPNLSNFTDEAYNYLVKRLNETHNPLLKARYAHLLWLSPKKDIEYAKIALTAYIDLFNFYEKKDKENPNEDYGLDLLKSVQSLFDLSASIKQRTDEVCNLILNIITTYNLTSSSSFVIRYQLIELALRQKKYFSKEMLKDIPNTIINLVQELLKVNRFHNAIDMLTLGERVDIRCQTVSHHWGQQKAEIFELLIDQNKDNPLGAIFFCERAIEQYQILKQNSKINGLKQIYGELRKQIRLGEVATEVDMTDIVTENNKQADQITELSTDEILKVLIFSPLFPSNDLMEKEAERQSKMNFISSMFSTSVLDSRGHHAQHFSEEEEKKYFSILRNYEMYMNLICLHKLNQIITKGIQKKKLSAETVIDFLNKTWYSEEIHRPDFTGNMNKHVWLDLLTPSIRHYFDQMIMLVEKESYKPNVVLCVDSLVLKIEGLIRDLCEFNGEETSFQTKSNDKTIMREKDINALLYSTTVKELFTKDDQLLFKFVLIEQAGYNLRNKIAHSLIYSDQYSYHLMNLLIVLLLKICRFDIVDGGTHA